jgi:hypothetical protein
VVKCVYCSKDITPVYHVTGKKKKMISNTIFSDNQVSDIQDLCVCILGINDGDFKAKLKLELFNFVMDCKRKNDNTLTEKEVLVGQTQSKLNCVKMVKERTGKALLESKLLVEKYFMDNGYKFYSPRPS